MNMCGLKVLCERFAHKYGHTHMYDDLVNRGALERCSQGYPELVGDLHMLCPHESTSHII